MSVSNDDNGLMLNFFDNIVIPTVKEFLSPDGFIDIRKAMLACIVLCHTYDYMTSIQDKRILDKNKHFNIIRDSCNASKHCRLTRNKNRNIDSIQQVAYRAHEDYGLFDAPFGYGYFNTEGIYVKTNEGELVSVADVVSISVNQFSEMIDLYRKR